MRFTRDWSGICKTSVERRCDGAPQIHSLTDRSDDDDELRLPDEWQSYYVFFLTVDGEAFRFNDETDGIEVQEDPQGEASETVFPGEGWIGCAVGISFAAPYAAMNLCCYSCYEDGTTSIPDVESFIYREETQRRVDADQYYREILSREAFQKLEALRVEIASILAKHRLRVLDRAVRVPGLKAGEDVFLEEPLRVQDTFFFRGV